MSHVDALLSLRRGTVPSGNEVGKENEPSNSSNQVPVSNVAHKMESDFELLKMLGKGGYGKVYQVCEKSTNKIYAMKVVLKKNATEEPADIEHMKTERAVLIGHNSEFLCTLKYAFQSDTKLFLVMEYMIGGDLFTTMENAGKFTEEESKFYLAQIVLGLEALHSLKTLFRDLKPDNVLLDRRGHCRLADFGLAKQNLPKGAITHTYCGTPEYMAPEMICRKGHSYAVDWWGVGVIMYDMLTGSPPFLATNSTSVKKQVVQQKLALPKELSPDAFDLLKSLMRRNPSKRIDGEGVMMHRFFEHFDWTATRDMRAPYPPTVRGDRDVSMFDQDFTGQEVVLDKADPIDVEYEDVFAGFEYTK